MAPKESWSGQKSKQDKVLDTICHLVINLCIKINYVFSPWPIEQPIDLKTIAAKIVENQYSNTSELEADIGKSKFHHYVVGALQKVNCFPKPSWCREMISKVCFQPDKK